jgi:hypothetical protein
MRWIEIIDIRSLRFPQALLELDLQALMAELATEKQVTRVEIYWHGELETDYSVHIHYRSDSDRVGRSQFGLHIVSLLKEFGLVHHSIWREMRSCESPEKDK